jgi:hypothetical protein
MKTREDGREFSDAEIERRRESALQKMLNTPHTPTKNIKRPRVKPQEK